MGSVIVVIVYVLPEQALEMTLVEWDHVIQQIAPATADPPLRYPILPWTSE